MAEHPIQGLMTTAMEHIKHMIDVNITISDPIQSPDGSVILTVSKVGFGFAAGGSEFSKQREDGTYPFGGGSGGGVSITPIAFLLVNSSGIKVTHLDENTHVLDKIIDLAPQAVEKVRKLLINNEKNKATYEETGL